MKKILDFKRNIEILITFSHYFFDEWNYFLDNQNKEGRPLRNKKHLGHWQIMR